ASPVSDCRLRQNTRMAPKRAPPANVRKTAPRPYKVPSTAAASGATNTNQSGEIAVGSKFGDVDRFVIVSLRFGTRREALFELISRSVDPLRRSWARLLPRPTPK